MQVHCIQVHILTLTDMYMQWRIQRGKGGASVPPFGLYLTLRSTDDKLNGTPLSGYRTATMAHLRRKFVQKQINWTGRAGSLSQK